MAPETSGPKTSLSLPNVAAISSFHSPTSLARALTSRSSQKPPSSDTSSRMSSCLAKSSRPTMDRWHFRKLATPPQDGLEAYWVLQKLPQVKGLMLVRIFFPVLGLVMVLGHDMRPKLAGSLPGPGWVSKAISQSGLTLMLDVYGPAWISSQRRGSSFPRFSESASPP